MFLVSSIDSQDINDKLTAPVRHHYRISRAGEGLPRPFHETDRPGFLGSSRPWVWQPCLDAFRALHWQAPSYDYFHGGLPGRQHLGLQSHELQQSARGTYLRVNWSGHF